MDRMMECRRSRLQMRLSKLYLGCSSQLKLAEFTYLAEGGWMDWCISCVHSIKLHELFDKLACGMNVRLLIGASLK